MKKLLAVLLAALVLLPFAFTEAAALTPEEELEAEALGYIEQAKAIIESGTFTLKAKMRYIDNNRGTRGTVSVVWIYDKENAQKLYEMDIKDIVNTTFYMQGAKFIERVTLFIFKCLFQIVPLLAGRKVRGFQVGSQLFVSFPQRCMYSSDAFELPYFRDMGFYEILPLFDFYIDTDNIIEVKKEGNRVSLLYGDGDYSKLFEFTDGNFSFYREVQPNGKIEEACIDSLSPIADQSYFSTKGMMKIRLGWLAVPFGWLEKLMAR